MGSAAGIQTRVQSGGSMADEAIERAYGRNLLLGSANVKWPMEFDFRCRGSGGFLPAEKKPGQEPGLIENRGLTEIPMVLAIERQDSNIRKALSVLSVPDFECLCTPLFCRPTHDLVYLL